MASVTDRSAPWEQTLAAAALKLAALLGAPPASSGHTMPPSISCHAGRLDRTSHEYRTQKRIMAQAIRQAWSGSFSPDIGVVDSLIQVRAVASRRMREERILHVIQEVVLAEVTASFHQEPDRAVCHA